METSKDTITKNHYAITDSIAKTVLIGGLTTAQTLALPHLITNAAFYIPALTPVAALVVAGITPLSLLAIAEATAISALACSTSYYFRIIARNDGHEYVGGYAAGLTKYALKGKLPLVNLAIGGPNNLAYELCNNNEKCSKEVAVNIAMTVITEALDGLAQAALTGKDPLTGAIGGAIIGATLSLDTHFLYANSIKHIHNFVDYFYVAFNHSEHIIDFINKTPINGFDDIYNQCLMS